MNLGFGELLVIGLLALIVFGPERLPSIARSAGRAWRSFQRETAKAAAELRIAADVTPDLGVIDRPDDAAQPPPPAAPVPQAAPAPAVRAPVASRPPGDPSALEDT